MTEKQGGQVVRTHTFGTLSSHRNFYGVADAALS